jgi:hypothetical protein
MAWFQIAKASRELTILIETANFVTSVGSNSFWAAGLPIISVDAKKRVDWPFYNKGRTWRQKLTSVCPRFSQ